MNIKSALLLLGCLLLAAIAMELTGIDQANQAGATVEGHVQTATAKAAGPAQRPIAQWQAAALARPLFSPDRRPAATAASADDGLPRLTGIIHSPAEAVAIFQPADKGKPVLARAGDTVGGWQIAAISTSVVDLRREANRLVLTPSFGTGDGVVARQQPPLNRWETPAATGILRARWSNAQLQP